MPIFVLISEGENVVVTGAFSRVSDAASARERYIDETWHDDLIQVTDRYGDASPGHPATALDVSVDEGIIETLTIQPAELDPEVLLASPPDALPPV